MRGYEDAPVTVTSVRDIAGVVRRAVEYEGGAWPVVGGVQGQQVSHNQLKQMVEGLIASGHGGGILPAGTTRLTVELADMADLRQGILNIEMPPITHASIPEDMRKAFYVPAWTGSLQSFTSGAWTVTDEWNQLLPDYKFISMEELVREAFKDE